MESSEVSLSQRVRDFSYDIDLQKFPNCQTALKYPLRDILIGKHEISLENAFENFFDFLSFIPNCPSCNVPETPEHFLLQCKKFRKHRQSFLPHVKACLRARDLKVTPDILLGFLPTCKKQSHEKQTRELRETIISYTLEYMKDTGRFESK